MSGSKGAVIFSIYLKAKKTYCGDNDANTHELVDAGAQDVVDRRLLGQSDVLLDVCSIQEGRVF